MRTISQQVFELEKERDELLKRERATLEFLCSVGDNDPRSGGFIARRAMVQLGWYYFEGQPVTSKELSFPCTLDELQEFLKQ